MGGGEESRALIRTQHMIYVGVKLSIFNMSSSQNSFLVSVTKACACLTLSMCHAFLYKRKLFTEVHTSAIYLAKELLFFLCLTKKCVSLQFLA